MPNHVKNILTIHHPDGPEAARSMLDRYLSPKTERHWTGKELEDVDAFHLDFEKVIPMPESLVGVPSGSPGSMDAVDLVMAKEVEDISPSDVLTPHRRLFSPTDDGLQRARDRRDDPGVLASLEAIRTTGYPSWYEWCVANWGTKWNSYHTEPHPFETDGAIGLCFQTAWSRPWPVIRAMSVMNPGVTLRLDWADEDTGHNCGWEVWCNGHQLTQDKYDYSAAIAIWENFSPAAIGERIMEQAHDDMDWQDAPLNLRGEMDKAKNDEDPAD